MIDPNYDRYVVRISGPDWCVKDGVGVGFSSLDETVGFSLLDEAKGYCREQSKLSEGLLFYRLFDLLDGVELDY